MFMKIRQPLAGMPEHKNVFRLLPRLILTGGKKMKTTEIKEQVLAGKYDALIEDLYADPSLLDYQKQRYAAALDKYQTLFGDDEVSIYSAAGRSEISGNHTDHQHGCVLAGSINLDAIGIVSKQDHIIKVISDDFDIKPIDLNDLDKNEDEL